MDGEEWLKNRRIMNNLLMKGDLSWMESACQVADSMFLERISQYENQIIPDLEHEVYKWAIDVTIATLTGASVYRDCHKHLKDQLEILAVKVKQIFEKTIKLQLISARSAEYYGLLRWKRFEQVVTEALKCSKHLLEEIHNNFLGQDGLFYKMTQVSLSKDLIERIIVDLILGAGDTTSNTLSWALYALAKNEDVQDRLRLEMQLKTKPKESLVKNIIKETLRVYPSAPFLTRTLPDPTSICGYLIPANTLIVMSIYTSGRDSRYFKNPEKFVPSRWVRDAWEEMPKTMASLPFGLGSRSCVGRRIAEIALFDTLSTLVLNYNITTDNGNDVGAVLRMILKPNKPLRLRITKI